MLHSQCFFTFLTMPHPLAAFRKALLETCKAHSGGRGGHWQFLALSDSHVELVFVPPPDQVVDVKCLVAATRACVASRAFLHCSTTNYRRHAAYNVPYDLINQMWQNMGHAADVEEDTCQLPLPPAASAVPADLPALPQIDPDNEETEFFGDIVASGHWLGAPDSEEDSAPEDDEAADSPSKRKAVRSWEASGDTPNKPKNFAAAWQHPIRLLERFLDGLAETGFIPVQQTSLHVKLGVDGSAVWGHSFEMLSLAPAWETIGPRICDSPDYTFPLAFIAGGETRALFDAFLSRASALEDLPPNLQVEVKSQIRMVDVVLFICADHMCRHRMRDCTGPSSVLDHMYPCPYCMAAPTEAFDLASPRREIMDRVRPGTPFANIPPIQRILDCFHGGVCFVRWLITRTIRMVPQRRGATHKALVKHFLDIFRKEKPVWAGYRIHSDQSAISAFILRGGPDILLRHMAESCGDMVDVPASLLGPAAQRSRIDILTDIWAQAKDMHCILRLDSVAGRDIEYFDRCCEVICVLGKPLGWHATPWAHIVLRHATDFMRTWGGLGRYSCLVFAAAFRGYKLSTGAPSIPQQSDYINRSDGADFRSSLFCTMLFLSC